MLLIEIPYYLFHLISLYFTKYEILRISQVCKRFNLLLYDERYFKYINCGKCNSKEETNKLGHLGCFNKLNTDTFCLISINETILKHMQIHFLEWIFVKYLDNLSSYEDWKNFFIERITNKFIKVGNLECLEYIMKRTIPNDIRMDDFYRKAEKYQQSECSMIIQKQRRILWTNKMKSIRYKTQILRTGFINREYYKQN